jgi:hypothetical protein
VVHRKFTMTLGAVGRIVAVGALLLAPAPPPLFAQTPKPVLIGGDWDERASLVLPRQVEVVAGRIVVLEAEAPFIKVFSLDGRLLQRLGGSGAGPGELRYAAAMLHIPELRRLVVFDTPNARAAEYAIGDSLTFVRALATALPVNGACALGRRVFVSAHDAAGMIHELEPRGGEWRTVRSFGSPTVTHPLALHPLFRSYAASGSLFCDAVARRILLASRVVGVLHSIKLDGSDQQTVPIAGFEPVAMEAAPDGGFTQRTPDSGEYDQVVGFRAATGGARIIVGRADREHHGADDYASYRDVWVERGGVLRALRRSPWYVVGSSEGRTVCYRTAPAPIIAITRSSTCPE